MTLQSRASIASTSAWRVPVGSPNPDHVATEGTGDLVVGRLLAYAFAPGPCVTGDPINDAKTLHEIYTSADPHYTGRATVPLLWDKVRHTIVSNESAEILRMFNSAFDALGDYYPEPLRAEIDALNECIYRDVNNGVYRGGFATTQAAYEEAVVPLFETLDWLEARLSRSRYLLGERLTEADIRLFTTPAHFDAVYYGHFKCNLRRIVDYPALLALHPRRLRPARRRGDGEYAPHLAPLLRKSHGHQSNGRGVARTGDRLFDADRSTADRVAPQSTASAV
jgi:glutathionyl-hydroquinone reductase